MSDTNVERQLRVANTEFHRQIASLEERLAKKERTDAVLRDSEKRYRRLFESAKDGILILDADTGKVVDVNPFLLQLLGYSYDALCGKHIWEIGAFKDILASKSALKNLQVNEYIRYENLPLQTIDGQPLAVEFVSNVYLVGHIKVIQCNIRDITERKRVEEALRENQAFLTTLLNAIPVPVFYKDIAGRYLGFNTAFEEFLGKTRDQMTGQSVFDIIPRELADVYHAKDAELLQNPSTQIYDAQVKDACGALHDVVFHKATFMDTGGHVLGLIGGILDITEHKRAEETLRESEQKYRILIDATNAGYVIVDEEAKVIDANAAYLRLTGYESLQQILGRSVVEWTAEHDRVSYTREVGMCVESSGCTHNLEIDYVDEDGCFTPVEINASAIRTAEGFKILMLCRDITERKQAEKRLLDSESKFRSYIEHAPPAVFVADREGRILDFNPSAANILGYEAATLSDMNVMDMHSEADRKAALRDFTTLLEKGCVEAEHRIKRQDGSLAWISLHAVMITDQLSLTYCLDITERKRAEETLSESHRELHETALRLEQSRNMLQLVVESIPVRVFWKDSDLRYLGCNILVARDAGLSRPEQLLGLDDFAMGWREQAECYRADDRKVMESGLPKLNIVEQQSTPTGAKMWLNTSKVPLLKPNGEVFGILGVYEDITERKQAEEDRDQVEAQLRQAQKMEALGTLAGGIAHDFNNMLGIIMGFTELAKLESGESPVKSKLDEVLKAANRAKELVKQILAFSRRTEPQKMPLQLGMIVKDALKILRPSLPSTVEIKTDVLSKTTVVADPTQMHQVLMNLCTNAAHAMQDQGGVLEVRLTDVLVEDESISSQAGLQHGLYVKLTVRDTGCGINPAIIDSIFDPFFTTKELGEGTGLGLSVVHGIIESHQGKINVESKLGEGTRFTVLIPALKSECTSRKAEAHTLLPRGQERVLVVDDEPQLAEVVKQMLKSLGYDVVLRTSGTEALEVLCHQPLEKRFDLVITDMTMPHFTGADLASELCGFEPVIPVIIMTGFSNNMNEEKAKSLGIQGFLMKPVALEQLAKTVREVLDRTVKYVGEVSPALLPKSSLTGQFTDTEKSTAAFAAVSLDHPGCNASPWTGEYHEEHGHKKNSGRR